MASGYGSKGRKALEEYGIHVFLRAGISPHTETIKKLIVTLAIRTNTSMEFFWRYPLSQMLNLANIVIEARKEMLSNGGTGNG